MRAKLLVVLVVVVAVVAIVVGLGGGHQTRTLHGASAAAKSASSSAGASSAAAQAAQPAGALVAHAGLAFGTFFRFIYAPYKAGQFAPAVHNRAALAQAAAAARYVGNELSLAAAAAHSSAPLSKLAAPLKVLAEGFSAALVKLKAGDFNTSEIEAANVAIGSIKGQAAQAGLTISESTPSSF